LTVSTGLLSGAEIAGHCLLRPLGHGTQSRVFLAKHQKNGQLVALKVANLESAQGGADAARDFLQSAQLARGLVHPNIVAVHDAGQEGSLVWLSMEAVAGTDLGRYTHAPRLLPELLTLKVVEQVSLALDCAHRNGIVHRDVKPANVLLDWTSQTIKLTDFGLAGLSGVRNTGTGIVLGTPAYMAPEQLAGGLPSASTDLYAVGVLLFELLVGQLPYTGRNMGELLKQVALLPAPDLRTLRPDLPPALADLIARLLAKTPLGRPHDGGALALALRQIGLDMTAAGAKSR
jgi:serine/threonine-protein kinase